MQYCNLIWGNAAETILRPLALLQDKLVKIINFAPFELKETEHLYSHLKILKLKDINALSKAKFVYKFKNGKLPSNFNNFLSVNPLQRSLSMRSQGIRNDYKCIWGKSKHGSKMIQYEGALLWNSIFQEFRDMPTLKSSSLITTKLC